MTQLTIVTVHHIKEMNPNTEIAAKNNSERQLVGLHQSPDVELQVINKQV